MKRSIKFKILSLFILIFIFFMSNSIWSIFNFNKLTNSIEDIMEDNYKSIVASQHMAIAIERQDSSQLAYMFNSDEVATTTFLENKQIFLEWLSKEKTNITEKGEKQIVDDISKNYAIYIEKFDILTQIQKVKGNKDSRIYYYNEVLPLFETIKDECRKLQSVNQDGMLNRKDTAHNRAMKATYSTLIFSISTILGGIFLAFYLVNKIVRPIYDFIEKTKKIAQGDYTQQLDIHTSDEIGILAAEFNIMTEKLKYYEFLNIKKLMKEKQKSESIVETISDGIIVTDEYNRIILVNRAAEKAFAINEIDVLSKNFLDVIKKEDMFEAINNVKSNDKSDKKYIDVTIENKNKRKYYRVITKPIIIEENENIGVVTLMQDITKLKEIDNLKSDFISTVSHEFRTPLTSIVMGTSLLLDKVVGDINPDQKELLEAIKEDGHRLKNLVNDLLDLSKIESGKIQMDIKSEDIEDIIKYSVKPFSIQAKEKNILVDINIPSFLSKVKVDFDKISLVIINLIGNAFKYVPTDGSGKIKINAKETGNKILVSIADNGQGIPEEYLEKVFEKFVQVKDVNNQSKGTGLGLAISREIINAHRGAIWVESKINEGCTFYFTLNIDK